MQQARAEFLAVQMLDDWDTSEDWRKKSANIPDFSNWKNHDAFERAFAPLEKDLRMSIGK